MVHTHIDKNKSLHLKSEIWHKREKYQLCLSQKKPEQSIKYIPHWRDEPDCIDGYKKMVSTLSSH